METIDFNLNNAPQVGDVIFFRTKFSLWSPMSWLSALIRFFARIKYNHVGIIAYDDVTGELCVFEAVAKGITSTSFEKRIENRQVIVRRPRPYIKKDDAYYFDLCNKYKGYKYDKAGLLWEQLILQLTGKWVGTTNKEKAMRKFYCYEFAAFVSGEQDWLKINPKTFLTSTDYRTIFTKLS